MFAKIVKISGAILVSLGLLLAIPSMSQATGVEKVFWVGGSDSSHLRIYSVDFTDYQGTPGAVTAVTGDATAEYTGGALASDATHLYFATNQIDGGWDLVRSDLAGGNQLVLARGIDEPQYIRVVDGVVYYTAWNLGLYSVPADGSAGLTHLFGPGHAAGLGQTMPNSGFGPFVFYNNKLYMDVHNYGSGYGLIQADWSGSQLSNATVVLPDGYLALNVTDMAVYSNGVAFGTSNDAGFYVAPDPTTPVSGWIYTATTGNGNSSGIVSRLTFDSNWQTIYTTSTGYVYANGMFTWPETSTPETAVNYGVTVVSNVVTPDNTGRTLANTGGGLGLAYLGLGLIVVGALATRFRKN